MTKPLTAGALAATACLPREAPLGGSPLDVVAKILSECADYLDSQANHIDPHGTAGAGKAWDFMQAARHLRDVHAQMGKVTTCDET